MILNQNKFNFDDLFIFEMANNHQGSVEHGKRIINELADIAERTGTNAAVKLQFRDLDTFIHPDHRENSSNKHIHRFISTKLTEEQFAELIRETKERGLTTICTPFDETSVDRIVKLGIEIIKIGSCSAHDWPLLEKIAEVGKPVICSVGGLTIKDIDKIVSFFQHKGIYFALMHCVAIYPTPNDKFHVNQIEIMRNRYPKIVIGFSTHEDPSNTTAIKMAYAKGARIYEKHVGVTTDKITLNSYSATPMQVEAWINAWKEAVEICGPSNEREISSKEKEDLFSLKRGVYAFQPTKKGMPLHISDVFFAMPIVAGQLPSGEWRDGLIADRDYLPKEAISVTVTQNYPSQQRYVIAHIIHDLKGLLNTARVVVGDTPNLELSHHYGLELFHECGAAIIDCINREYCKKIIIQLAGQHHPTHHHKKKEEAFQVLYGELFIDIEGNEKLYYPGDVIVVPRGAWHGFRTEKGVIFEEVSTTHFNDDSFYQDARINQMTREQRKTKLINWGYQQFE